MNNTAKGVLALVAALALIVKLEYMVGTAIACLCIAAMARDKDKAITRSMIFNGVLSFVVESLFAGPFMGAIVSLSCIALSAWLCGTFVVKIDRSNKDRLTVYTENADGTLNKKVELPQQAIVVEPSVKRRRVS